MKCTCHLLILLSCPFVSFMYYFDSCYFLHSCWNNTNVLALQKLSIYILLPFVYPQYLQVGFFLQRAYYQGSIFHNVKQLTMQLTAICFRSACLWCTITFGFLIFFKNSSWCLAGSNMCEQ